MKNFKTVISKASLFFFLILIFQFSSLLKTHAQYPGISDDIAKHRKGTLIIQAKRGGKVTVEQLSHEFWFGCAISNGFVGARCLKMMSGTMVKNF